MPRRCRLRSVTGLIGLPGAALLLAFVVLVPARAGAQTANDPYDDLLQPSSLPGNPTDPPSFVPPGPGSALPGNPPTGTFAAPEPAPSRIGATPVYGSPSGFGAGNTGFNSSNVPPKQPQAADQGSALAPAPETTFDALPALPPPVSSVPPPLPQPPPAVVYPAKAAARPGAVLPPPPDQLPISNPPPVVYPQSAATRPGATLPIPPPQFFQGSASTPPPGTPPPVSLPFGTVPHPTLPIAAGDPYAALGIEAGSFLILPAVELSAGYNTNPTAAPGGPGSLYFVVAPELHVRSNWATNSFTADITGSYADYPDNDSQPSLNVPYLNAKADGTLDVTRTTQILLEARSIVSTDNPGSPNIQFGLATLPIDTTVGGTFGAAHQFGRIDVSLKGTFDRSSYSSAQLTDGETADFDDRDFDQYAGILRVGYEIDPGLQPFVEIDEDTRVYDLPADIFGEDRDSNGSSAKLGATLNLANSLSGEIAAGYMERDYKDPALPNIAGPTIDGSLLWQATALTTAKLTAASIVTESPLEGVSGEFSRSVTAEVDHALRTWLIANAQLGYEYDQYVGLGRDDNHYFAAAGLTYNMNREVQLRGEVRQDWLNSNVSGVAYTATTFLLTMRLQR
ncbi:MAG: outer membrane beta-barrel protein [Xanthobacteraceae bacterium]